MEIEKISIKDISYPEKLKRIDNPPKVLYAIGNIELLNKDGVAIVGSRNCTKEGTINAKVFAANLAKEGMVIISGMAKGIDAAAHTGAIEVGRKNYCSTWKWSKVYISFM